MLAAFPNSSERCRFAMPRIFWSLPSHGQQSKSKLGRSANPDRAPGSKVSRGGGMGVTQLRKKSLQMQSPFHSLAVRMLTEFCATGQLCYLFPIYGMCPAWRSSKDPQTAIQLLCSAWWSRPVRQCRPAQIAERDDYEMVHTAKRRHPALKVQERDENARGRPESEVTYDGLADSQCPLEGKPGPCKLVPLCLEIPHASSHWEQSSKRCSSGVADQDLALVIEDGADQHRPPSPERSPCRGPDPISSPCVNPQNWPPRSTFMLP